jgi:hypothetical protein
MINYETIKVGDKVKVISVIPAPFAKVGRICEVVKKHTYRDYPALTILNTETNEENIFFNNCGFSMLEEVKDGK